MMDGTVKMLAGGSARAWAGLCRFVQGAASSTAFTSVILFIALGEHFRKWNTFSQSTNKIDPHHPEISCPTPTSASPCCSVQGRCQGTSPASPHRQDRPPILSRAAPAWHACPTTAPFSRQRTAGSVSIKQDAAIIFMRNYLLHLCVGIVL